MQLSMPDNVKLIINKLQDEGFEAYAVGGCVRDSFLGEVPSDWDITTNALPMQVKKIFRRTIDVGIEHGTVAVMIGNEGYEVTTYRIDGIYEDSRHPKDVTFTSRLDEDLMRRDFTINAMAYSERTGIIDLYGGIEDLNSKIIRAVGNPRERFAEDALRILRALRFAARFDCEIEEDTKQAIIELAPTLSRISAERIRTELEKMMLTNHPEKLVLAYELGITKVIFPEWDECMKCEQNTPYHYLNVGEHTMAAMKKLVQDYSGLDAKRARIIRLATLFHDIGKPISKTTDADGVDHFKGHPEKGAELTRKIMQRLKYDNDTIDKVTNLVRYHDTRPALKKPGMRRFISKVKAENMPDLLILKRADMDAHSDYKREDMKNYERIFSEMTDEIIKAGDCLTIKDLAISGSDLIAMGVKPGPNMGQILNELLEQVFDNPERNTKDWLQKYVSEHF